VVEEEEEEETPCNQLYIAEERERGDTSVYRIRPHWHVSSRALIADMLVYSVLKPVVVKPVA